MINFNEINFRGTFRNYQQRVLDSSNNYLKNNKIHIVAAPGSGKTILGLELIRRLNSPCLILSPTNTIRYQWGERFKEMFLPDNEKITDYISFDLFNIKPITSITYQALHSAIDKIICEDEESLIDYTNVDLFKTINDFGIKTICVDEAHHLQNEWQKALEKFIKGLGKDVKIIALTATPPYDSTPLEWSRYIDICGEIDEEIFVTELVRTNNLCPHQDYVYLSYPTQEENSIFIEHQKNVSLALEELKKYKWKDILTRTINLVNTNNNEVLKNIKKYESVFVMFNHFGLNVYKNKINSLIKVKETTVASLEELETALNFLITSGLLKETENNKIKNILSKFNLMERNKVCLVINSKLEKQLFYSLSKLESITKIVKAESENLKENLRLLILTDYIKNSTKSYIGTPKLFKDISVVSIFESIRRQKLNMSLGILSGTLVILPSCLEKEIRNLLNNQKDKLEVKSLSDTGYSEYIFNVSNKEKVNLIGKLFEMGEIQVLVGTKSLLGEGWDSPCVNSLIMASFVGSFMLSNQMRGRAIRVYKQDKFKTSNIWHLVTLLPEDKNQSLECTEETSSDYKTLKRRFNCFVGPNYLNSNIESGIDRIAILRDTYTEESVKFVNKKMIELANNRVEMASKWCVGMPGGTMNISTSIPFDRIPKGLNLINVSLFFIFALITYFLSFGLVKFFVGNFFFKILSFAVLFVMFIISTISLYNLYKAICIFNKKGFVKSISYSIIKSLNQVNCIKSDFKLKVEKDSKLKVVNVELINNNLKEQQIFANCLKEMLYPISENRYIICKKFFNIFVYKYCYAIPAEFDKNKNAAFLFKQNLNLLGKTELIYTKNKINVNKTFMCKSKSYINSGSKEIKQKQIL